MQNVVAALEWAAMGDGGIELLQFRFQMLVDQQQGFQRTADVAIATLHNLINGSFARSSGHRKSSNCPWHRLFGARLTHPLIVWKSRTTIASMVGVTRRVHSADDAA